MSHRHHTPPGRRAPGRAPGRALADRGHDDHHLASRRGFLRSLGLLTAGAALVPGMPVRALGSARLTGALLDNPGDNILVLIRLKGGNDGLNTFVPVFDYGAYAEARPSLALPRNTLTPLTEALSVGPAFASAAGLYERDRMRVVSGVGYAEGSLSHFRGTDVVTSGSDAEEVITSGWLGRHLDARFPDFLDAPPAVPPAIQVGAYSGRVFVNDEDVNVAMTVSTIEELEELARTGELYPTATLPDCRYGEELGYLRAVANGAFTFAAPIQGAYGASDTEADYPEGDLSRQLALVARLIKGGLGTRIYLVSLDGFDTHANQEDAHASLLRDLGEGVTAFLADLAAAGLEERVLAATFSEFGRRIDQNASGGTDHGAAAPMMLFGSALNGSGVHGEHPDLRAPDPNGNLAFTTDYRRVYATLLERWLCVPPAEVDAVLGGTYDRLDLGFACPGNTSPVAEARVERGPAPRVTRRWADGFELSWEATAGPYRLDVVDALGRLVASYPGPAGPGPVRLEAALPPNLPDGLVVWALRDGQGRTSSGVLPRIGG